MKRLTILLIFLLFVPFVSRPLFALEKIKAVEQDTFFIPMRLGEAKETEINLVNTSKKASKLFIRFVEKSFPKGDENKWFAKFCTIGLCFFEEGETAVIRSGEATPVNIGIFATEEASINQVAKLVLEIFPVVDKNLKTTITLYAVCVPPKEIKLTIGQKEASVNGKQVSLETVPFLSENRAFVPLRFLGENFDMQVMWEAKTQKITFHLFVLELNFWIGNQAIQLKIGPEFTRDIPIDAAPILVSNRTYIPLRVVSENIGAQVLYDPATRQITIHFPPLPKYDY